MVLYRWKKVQIISDNGNINKDAEKENKFGQTALNLKDIGQMIWQMEKEG